MVGLFFIKDGKNRAKLAWGGFGAYVVLMVVLGVLMGIFAPSFDPTTGTVSSGIMYTIVSILRMFVALVCCVGSMIYTRDEVTRSYPNLGSPLIFKKSIDVPQKLGG